MKKFSNYDSIEANDFTPIERITPGPHLCVIKDAYEIEYNRKDGSGKFSMLLIRFDIAGDDEFAGFYERKYARKIKEEDEKEGGDSSKVNYEGVYRMSIPLDDGSENDEKTKVNFKTVINAIEKSNPNFEFDFNEKKLIGKKFCGVFGIEEFENLMGQVIYSTKCRFIRSTENMDKITIPKVKLIDKTYIEYEDWLKQKEAEKNRSSLNSTTEFTVSEENEDLPF